VLILEAMKMEVALETDDAIEIIEILVLEGSSVKAGQALVIAKLISP
jgi:biotin carboxyl carrier protein